MILSASFKSLCLLLFLCLLCRQLAEFTEGDTAIFLVKGLSVGQTSLSAFVVDNVGRKMASAPQPIEVYFYLNL